MNRTPILECKACANLTPHAFKAKEVSVKVSNSKVPTVGMALIFECKWCTNPRQYGFEDMIHHVAKETEVS